MPTPKTPPNIVIEWFDGIGHWGYVKKCGGMGGWGWTKKKDDAYQFDEHSAKLIVEGLQKMEQYKHHLFEIETA